MSRTGSRAARTGSDAGGLRTSAVHGGRRGRGRRPTAACRERVWSLPGCGGNVVRARRLGAIPTSGSRGGVNVVTVAGERASRHWVHPRRRVGLGRRATFATRRAGRQAHTVGGETFAPARDCTGPALRRVS